MSLFQETMCAVLDKRIQEAKTDAEKFSLIWERTVFKHLQKCADDLMLVTNGMSEDEAEKCGNLLTMILEDMNK